MTITRTELKKQYEQNHNVMTDQLVKDMFTRIRNEVTSCNFYGSTIYSKDFNYVQYWNQSLIDKVVVMLKEYYIDSKVLSCNKVIYIDWSLPKDDITITDHILNDDEKDNNIQINISLPSRIRTRSSANK